MDAAHTGWLGKKPVWKVIVWAILERRLREKTLTTRKYVVKEKAPEQQKPRSTAASSSSKVETWLGPNPAEQAAESGTLEDQSVGFPKPPVVEPCAPADPCSEEGETTEKPDSDPDADMKRWVEMVEGVGMLENIDWLGDLPAYSAIRNALHEIFKQGMRYCRDFQDGVLLPWKFDMFPLVPRAWLGEFERTLKAMAQRSELPYWLKHPSDRNIRGDASESADGFSDPGNFDLDVIVHAMRLWQYCDASKAGKVIRQPTSAYGASSNKSSKGPVNLRGNIVEAMTKKLQKAGGLKPNQWPYDPFKYWFEEDHWRPEPGYETASKGSKSGKGWSKGQGTIWHRKAG